MPSPSVLPPRPKLPLSLFRPFLLLQWTLQLALDMMASKPLQRWHLRVIVLVWHPLLQWWALRLSLMLPLLLNLSLQPRLLL